VGDPESSAVLVNRLGHLSRCLFRTKAHPTSGRVLAPSGVLRKRYPFLRGCVASECSGVTPSAGRGAPIQSKKSDVTASSSSSSSSSSSLSFSIPQPHRGRGQSRFMAPAAYFTPDEAVADCGGSTPSGCMVCGAICPRPMGGLWNGRPTACCGTLKGCYSSARGETPGIPQFGKPAAGFAERLAECPCAKREKKCAKRDIHEGGLVAQYSHSRGNNRCWPRRRKRRRPQAEGG